MLSGDKIGLLIKQEEEEGKNNVQKTRALFYKNGKLQHEFEFVQDSGPIRPFVGLGSETIVKFVPLSLPPNQ